MKYKVRYTPQDQRDMDDIWDGVWEASKDYDTADKYIEDLAYKAFYRIRNEYIEVVRVLPEKMDYMKILFGESE